MPSRSVSIRAIETERYKVIDQQTEEILEEIEESKAFFQVMILIGYVVHLWSLSNISDFLQNTLHIWPIIVLNPVPLFYWFFIVQVYEGAAYMRQGKTYLVNSLDLSNKIALCKVADLKYYTKSRDCTDIEVVGGKIVRPFLTFILLFFQVHIVKTLEMQRLSCILCWNLRCFEFIRIDLTWILNWTCCLPG